MLEAKTQMKVPTVVRTHRDFFGSVIGIAAFLGGVALLLVFKLAYEMFNVPASKVIVPEGTKQLDLNAGISSLFGVMIRIMLLLVMGLVGSWIANRGITLYTEARGIKVNVDES